MEERCKISQRKTRAFKRVFRSQTIFVENLEEIWLEKTKKLNYFLFLESRDRHDSSFYNKQTFEGKFFRWSLLSIRDN